MTFLECHVGAAAVTIARFCPSTELSEVEKFWFTHYKQTYLVVQTSRICIFFRTIEIKNSSRTSPNRYGIDTQDRTAPYSAWFPLTTIIKDVALLSCSKAWKLVIGKTNIVHMGNSLQRMITLSRFPLTFLPRKVSPK